MNVVGQLAVVAKMVVQMTMHDTVEQVERLWQRWKQQRTTTSCVVVAAENKIYNNINYRLVLALLSVVVAGDDGNGWTIRPHDNVSSKQWRSTVCADGALASRSMAQWAGWLVAMVGSLSLKIAPASFNTPPSCGHGSGWLASCQIAPSEPVPVSGNRRTGSKNKSRRR